MSELDTLIENLEAIYTDVMENLLPENLKKDITLLGVEGTLENGANITPSVIMNIIAQNGIVYKDSTTDKNTQKTIPLCTVWKHKEWLKKYYCFWAMGGVFDEFGYQGAEYYLITDDVPLNIAFLEDGVTLKIIPGDTTKQYIMFQYDDQIGQNMIFTEEDVEVSLLTKLNELDASNFKEKTTPIELSYVVTKNATGLYNDLRLITNNQILDANGTILVESNS